MEWNAIAKSTNRKHLHHASWTSCFGLIVYREGTAGVLAPTPTFTISIMISKLGRKSSSFPGYVSCAEVVLLIIQLWTGARLQTMLNRRPSRKSPETIRALTLLYYWVPGLLQQFAFCVFIPGIRGNHADPRIASVGMSTTGCRRNTGEQQTRRLAESLESCPMVYHLFFSSKVANSALFLFRPKSGSHQFHRQLSLSHTSSTRHGRKDTLVNKNLNSLAI